MADILYPPTRPQSVGEVLDTTFRIFRRTLVKCLPLAIPAVIVLQLPNFYLLIRRRSLAGRPPFSDAAWDVLYVVGLLLFLVLSAAILLRQYAIATGHTPVARSEIGTGLRRLGGMVLWSILFTLALGISLIPLVLVRVVEGWPRIAVFGVTLLPACFYLLAVSVSWPLMLLADLGSLESLNRSARLTWGSWSRLTLIYTVGVVLVGVLYFLFTFLIGFTAGILGSADIITVTAITTALLVLLGAISAPFTDALMLAVLGDLLVRKEGADLEQRITAPASV